MEGAGLAESHPHHWVAAELHGPSAEPREPAPDPQTLCSWDPPSPSPLVWFKVNRHGARPSHLPLVFTCVQAAGAECSGSREDCTAHRTEQLPQCRAQTGQALIHACKVTKSPGRTWCLSVLMTSHA